MSIPTNITDELENLQNQVAQYSPLNNAPHAAIVAMQLNAGQLVSDVQAALNPTTSLIDTFTAPSDAPSIVNGVLNVASLIHDQASLSLMRGIVGRVASNLDQF